ncbi:helix-turn-helix domain-containing protein [Aestuariimicrobium soli]|uniref:helix-turn-helix domain-containing protein n=1 Tax=Aestuariimicrobium soli TaxID=2035834 RepID=UPI003EBD0EDE
MSPLNHEPEALRYALDKSGLTQKQLAEAVGCSQSLVSEMLAGTRNAKPGQGHCPLPLWRDRSGGHRHREGAAASSGAAGGGVRVGRG